MQYAVYAIVTSPSIDNGAPTEVEWYRGDDLARAIAAQVSAAAHHTVDETNPIPPEQQVKTLSVQLIFIDPA